MTERDGVGHKPANGGSTPPHALAYARAWVFSIPKGEHGMTPTLANLDLQNLADAYVGKRIKRGHNYPVDKPLAAEIAAAYERLPMDDYDPFTRKCYQALCVECVQQYNILVTHGYRIMPWTQQGQPYASSEEMADDLRYHKRLYVYTGGEPHPYMGHLVGPVINGVKVDYTYIFRAVHDTFGHAAEGFTFSQRGEENAWVHHSLMFTLAARRALTTETRGQNSWFHESPVNAGLPYHERQYAPQKLALLPARYCDLPR